MMRRSGLNVEVTEAINCTEGVKKLNINIFDFALSDCQVQLPMGFIYHKEFCILEEPVSK